MDLKREILMVNCADMDQPTPDNSWGSTGPLSCGKRFENVVGIRLLKHNLNGSALIYVPEWAPHCVGSYAYKQEISVVVGDYDTPFEYDPRTINQRIPEYLSANNNYYALLNSITERDRAGGLAKLSLNYDEPVLVAEINNREAPFNFDRVSHAVWLISNSTPDGVWGIIGNTQMSHTYYNNINNGNSAPVYKQPGWNSTIYWNNKGTGQISTHAAQPYATSPLLFVYEIIMVDETSHIARMPNADQLAIEYKDKVEQTGRYKSNAAEINKAISAFKSFSK